MRHILQKFLESPWPYTILANTIQSEKLPKLNSLRRSVVGRNLSFCSQNIQGGKNPILSYTRVLQLEIIVWTSPPIFPSLGETSPIPSNFFQNSWLQIPLFPWGSSCLEHRSVHPPSFQGLGNRTQQSTWAGQNEPAILLLSLSIRLY